MIPGVQVYILKLIWFARSRYSEPDFTGSYQRGSNFSLVNRQEKALCHLQEDSLRVSMVRIRLERHEMSRVADTWYYRGTY